MIGMYVVYFIYILSQRNIRLFGGNGPKRLNKIITDRCGNRVNNLLSYLEILQTEVIVS